MIYFMDATFVSALALVVALVLGRFAESHAAWWVYANDWASMALSVLLTTMLVVGAVAASLGCVEHGMRAIVWMPVYVLTLVASAFAVRMFFALPRFRGRTPLAP